MNTLGERIADARREAGLSQSDLARRLGLRPQTINRWEHSRIAPSRLSLMRTAEVLGVSITWLLLGKEALQSSDGHDTVTPLPVARGAVPVLSVEHAAARNLSSPIEHIASAVDLAGASAAIRLADDSNAPRHPRGTIWALSYRETAVAEDLVLAIHGPQGKPILGQLSYETSDKGRVVVVSPLNAKWPGARSDLEHVEVVAVVVAYLHIVKR